MTNPSPDQLARLVRQAFGPEAELRRVEDLAGDASTRRYLRLHVAAAGAAPTLVAMLLADRAVAMSSDELASLPADLHELPYMNVHRFLDALGVAVPAVLLDASDTGVVLLEDIGDVALWDVVRDADPTTVRQWYVRAIDTLVPFQVMGTRAADPSCIAFHQAFDRTLARWELDHFVEWGIERHLGITLPAADAATLCAIFDAMAAEIDAAPRALNHRDFHSWNLYVQGDDIRVIDFQDALLAPIPYDLATLLGDRDTPTKVTPDLEAELLEIFLDRWHGAGGAALDRSAFERLYFLCSLQKALKVVGRFHYLHLEKGKPGYLRYLPSTVRQIRRVAAQLEDTGALRTVLERYLPRAT